MQLPYWIRQENNEKKLIKTKELNPKLISNKEEDIKKFLPGSLVSKTREKIESCCAGIADRTLSLQYHQFANQLEDNELNLKDIKTYKLSEAEVEKYSEAIKKIGASKDASGKQFYTRNINIDIGGFSLEVAKELGYDYLRGNYILVSTEQRKCDNLRKYISFEKPLIKKFFDDYKNVVQILLGEALIGRYYNIDKSSFLATIASNPESIFNIEMIFDTPIDAIAKLKKIKEAEKELINNVYRIKDRKFLRNLLCDIEEIISKHGPLDRISDKELILKDKVDYFKFNLQSIDLYCLRTKKGIPIFIFFDYDNIMKESYRREDCIILNGEGTDSINVLIDLGIIGYSPYLGLERAANMIINKRKDHLNKFLENNPESSEEIRKLFLEELMRKEEIPENARELLLDIQSLVENKKDKNVFYGLKSKIFMVYPLIQNEILYEMLNRLLQNSNLITKVDKTKN